MRCASVIINAKVCSATVSETSGAGVFVTMTFRAFAAEIDIVKPDGVIRDDFQFRSCRAKYLFVDPVIQKRKQRIHAFDALQQFLARHDRLSYRSSACFALRNKRMPSSGMGRVMRTRMGGIS